MISVTRLNGSVFWVSADEIEFLEATPDTVVSLVSGKKLVVKESPEELVDRVVKFRRRIHFPPEILVDKQGKESVASPGDAD